MQGMSLAKFSHIPSYYIILEYSVAEFSIDTSKHFHTNLEMVALINIFIAILSVHNKTTNQSIWNFGTLDFTCYVAWLN